MKHPSVDKHELRQQLRRQRSALTARQIQLDSLRVCRRICSSLWYLRSRQIAAYLPARGEIDLTSVLAHALRRKASTCLPAIDPADGSMQMHRLDLHTALHVNPWGIEEPVSPLVPPSAINLILMPLVAFDDQGNRLGQGGGYYDRYLARLSGWHRPLKIGVAYAFQQVERLEPDPWDIPLDAVVTPEAVLHFSGRMKAIRAT